MDKDEFDRLARQHLEYLKATAPKTNWTPFIVLGVIAAVCIVALVLIEMGVW